MINLSSLIKTSQIFIKTVHFRAMSKFLQFHINTISLSFFLQLIHYYAFLFDKKD